MQRFVSVFFAVHIEAKATCNRVRAYTVILWFYNLAKIVKAKSSIYAESERFD